MLSNAFRAHICTTGLSPEDAMSNGKVFRKWHRSTLWISISCPFLTLSLLSAWVYLYYNRSRTLFVYGINSWFVFSVQNKIIYTCLAGITCSFTSFAFGVDRSMYHPLHLYFLVSSPRNAQVPAGAGRSLALFDSSFPFSLALQICITYVRQFSHL